MGVKLWPIPEDSPVRTQPVTPLVRMGWVLLCTLVLPWDFRALEDLPFIKAKHRRHPLIAYRFSCSPCLGEDKKYFRWTSCVPELWNVSRGTSGWQAVKYREPGTWCSSGRLGAVLADDGSACTTDRANHKRGSTQPGPACLFLSSTIVLSSSAVYFLTLGKGHGIRHVESISLPGFAGNTFLDYLPSISSCLMLGWAHACDLAIVGSSALENLILQMCCLSQIPI